MVGGHGGEVPWSTHDGIWVEYGWDMVSMVREGFDLEEMVVRTTIREQSLSLASGLGPNLGPILLAPIQIFVVGT